MNYLWMFFFFSPQQNYKYLGINVAMQYLLGVPSTEKTAAESVRQREKPVKDTRSSGIGPACNPAPH